MIKKILPILLAVVGTGAGIGAGIMMKPAPPPAEEHAAIDCAAPTGEVEHTVADADTGGDGEPAPAQQEYVKMSNQFIIPVMSEERVKALVVASLSLEVRIGVTEVVYAREPKLRDVLLQVMFDHANIGGFEGSFTNADRMGPLRRSLLEAARSVLGGDVIDVLITEIARQDT
ncbi:flagellar basal body-associated FliL family protein [Sagittula salina]|uniref:Flagellar basal body-associated FliL family protein n=1 Tax=Sagittula salina TaxID=2820268 RepID=A0A940MK86_9RHOB|nr:flagellar basal body-associated FliL family protein [Sagittula salina]MBP0483340.1 flagellar basal body-associated FliL family protein [Sagittula salina]